MLICSYELEAHLKHLLLWAVEQWNKGTNNNVLHWFVCWVCSDNVSYTTIKCVQYVRCTKKLDSTLMAYVCIIHLTTLSVAQVIQSQMIEWLINAHSAMMWKEMVVACSKAIFWHSPAKDLALLSGHSACRRSFKPEISLKQIKGVTYDLFSPDISSF
jgi:hypothetical protein